MEELRTRLLTALVGFVAASVLTFYFGQEILAILCRPLLMVQVSQGMQPQLQALSPTSGFVAYMKISMLAGLIVSAPWILIQAWRFVAAGLFESEKRFARSLIIPSVALFATGVLFLYFVVLPLALHFFLSFNRAFASPDLAPTAFQSWFLSNAGNHGSASSIPKHGSPPSGPGMGTIAVPIVATGPDHPNIGDVWFNSATGRLTIQSETGPRSVNLDQGASGSIVQSQFALDSYLTFVLMLALAFGLAFETPIVVFFMIWTGLCSVKTLTSSRKYVVLGIVFGSAIITPTPDLLSQLLLAGPMYLLFEAGLLSSRWAIRNRTPNQHSRTQD